MEREPIKDMYGKIIGFVETMSNGDKVAKDFYGKIVGKYSKRLNKTFDFYGKIVSKGDITAAMIWNSNNKK